MPVNTGCCGCTFSTFQAYDAPHNATRPFPNADAAAAAFLAAAGSTNLITFESASIATPTTPNGSLTLATGVVMSITNQDTFAGVSNDSSVPSTGYNTTPSGTKFFSFVPQFNAVGTVTFTFATPIKSFGAYLTGFESNLGNNVIVTYTDTSTSTTHTITLARPSTAGVGFWGSPAVVL